MIVTIENHVICQICKAIKQDLRNHHRMHNLTSKEYEKLYPNSPTITRTAADNVSKGISASFKHRPPVSEETKAKISQKSKEMHKLAKKNDPQVYYDSQRKNALAARTAKGDNFFHSEETKKKMSGPRLKIRGIPKSESHKQKLSEARKGKKFKPHSPETIIKMKATWARKKAENSDEYIKWKENNRLRMSTPEARLKMSIQSAKNIKERKHNGKSSDTKLERKFADFANKSNLIFETQYILVCEKGAWTFDFYIPSMNLLIETDGEYWHRKSKEQFNKDKIKERLALKMGFNFVRISDLDWRPEIIFEDKEIIDLHNKAVMILREGNIYKKADISAANSESISIPSNNL